MVGYYDEYIVPEPAAPLSIAVAAASDGGLDALTARIEARRREKERWAAAQRQQEEARRMEGCTFEPDTRPSRAVAVPEGPVEVRGLDRYLELKALAERQQAELQARAAKVFSLHPQSPRRRGPTVPRPFKLGTEARGALRAQSAAAAGRWEGEVD